jgi:hypothetical protein
MAEDVTSRVIKKSSLPFFTVRYSFSILYCKVEELATHPESRPHRHQGQQFGEQVTA